MPRQPSPEIAARTERLAALARQEKAALAEVDRSGARLTAARARRDSLVARADDEVAAAATARDAALGAYARHVGAERAALTLGEDARELRRLARQHAIPAAPDGHPGVEGAAAGSCSTRSRDASRG